MISEKYSKGWLLLRYCLSTNLGAQWLTPAALCLFAGSYLWRNYFDGKQDSVFFQVLSVSVLWYVFVFGTMRTLCELRNNSNSFLMEDVKKISYWIGLLSCSFVYAITFIFLEQFDLAGSIAFAVLIQPAVFFGRRWHKWFDVVRLSAAALTPFLLINIYVMFHKVFSVSSLWLVVIVCVASAFSWAIFYSHYKGWMNSPRNMEFLGVDITKNSGQRRYD